MSDIKEQKTVELNFDELKAFINERKIVTIYDLAFRFEAELDVLRDMFRFHAENERWFTNTKSVADVCLVRANETEYAGLFRILAENHVLFDVMEIEALEAGEDELPVVELE